MGGISKLLQQPVQKLCTVFQPRPLQDTNMVGIAVRNLITGVDAAEIRNRTERRFSARLFREIPYNRLLCRN